MPISISLAFRPDSTMYIFVEGVRYSSCTNESVLPSQHDNLPVPISFIHLGGEEQCGLRVLLRVARYSCAARCCKRQISCRNKRYIQLSQSRPRTGEVQTRHEYWNLYVTSCDHTTLWKALDANMVEIGARCSDKNVKILGRYQWIGWRCTLQKLRV